MTLGQAIPTIYNKQLFRSKLEADWARAFDALGVKWWYEPHGTYYGDIFYCPDFLLHKSRQWVEVKAVFQPDDCRKIHALLSHVAPRPFTDPWACPDFPLVACLPDGEFYAWERTETPTTDFHEFLTRRARPVALMRCVACNGWWFGDDNESWRCQCCGAYDGNAFLSEAIGSPLPGWPLCPRTEEIT